jgi:hypothetical protein
MENKDLNNIPQIPEITTEAALNLLLASIAYEELGLTHILEAEAKKIQSVLGTLKGQLDINTQASELEKLGNSVDKILKDVIKKDMLLGIKLENILAMSRPAPAGEKILKNTTGTDTSHEIKSAPTSETDDDALSIDSVSPEEANDNTADSASSVLIEDLSPASQAIQEDRQCKCSFTGNGSAVVTSEQDVYYGHIVRIEDPKVCTNHGSIDNSFIKYRILAEQDYIFIAFPATMQILPPNPFNPAPTPENPNVMIIMGRGSITSGLDEDEGQFTYIIRDGGEGVQADELQMIITADNVSSLSHNSGIMNLKGNIKINQNIV